MFASGIGSLLSTCNNVCEFRAHFICPWGGGVIKRVTQWNIVSFKISIWGTRRGKNPREGVGARWYNRFARYQEAMSRYGTVCTRINAQSKDGKIFNSPGRDVVTGRLSRSELIPPRDHFITSKIPHALYRDFVNLILLYCKLMPLGARTCDNCNTSNTLNKNDSWYVICFCDSVDYACKLPEYIDFFLRTNRNLEFRKLEGMAQRADKGGLTNAVCIETGPMNKMDMVFGARRHRDHRWHGRAPLGSIRGYSNKHFYRNEWSEKDSTCGKIRGGRILKKTEGSSPGKPGGYRMTPFGRLTSQRKTVRKTTRVSFMSFKGDLQVLGQGHVVLPEHITAYRKQSARINSSCKYNCLCLKKQDCKKGICGDKTGKEDLLRLGEVHDGFRSPLQKKRGENSRKGPSKGWRALLCIPQVRGGIANGAIRMEEAFRASFISDRKFKVPPGQSHVTWHAHRSNYHKVSTDAAVSNSNKGILTPVKGTSLRILSVIGTLHFIRQGHGARHNYGSDCCIRSILTNGPWEANCRCSKKYGRKEGIRGDKTIKEGPPRLGETIGEFRTFLQEKGGKNSRKGPSNGRPRLPRTPQVRVSIGDWITNGKEVSYDGFTSRLKYKVAMGQSHVSCWIQ